MQTDNLKAVLKNGGYSLTSPRQLVFGALLDAKPKSTAELIKELSGRVDRASIYRTTELFEKLDITHRVNTGWKYKVELSEMFIGHHHHMHCRRCGKIESLPTNTMLETMIDKVAASTNFSPRNHQLEVYGLCAECSRVS
jgi:Fe2+ or Zn2+ uptake regulation protein